MPEATNPELREELLRMMREDQSLIHVAQSDFACRHTQHKNRLKEIISEFGWPTRKMAGTDGSLAAWLIVQHDDDLPWMKSCLEKMESLMELDEVRREDVVYLQDRIHVDEGKPQRYGTQCTNDAKGHIILAPLEDPSRVDEYRRSMGIPEPVAEYLSYMRSRK